MSALDDKTRLQAAGWEEAGVCIKCGFVLWRAVSPDVRHNLVLSSRNVDDLFSVALSGNLQWFCERNGLAGHILVENVQEALLEICVDLASVEIDHGA